MGTAKTEWLKYVIDSFFKDSFIVVISSRKSYTDNFCSRVGAVNYQDNTHLELTNKTPIICIQLESIKRIKNLQSADLIVFDEIDSIITHAHNTESTNCSKIENLISLIEHKGSTKIYMDAFLSSGHIKIVKEISENHIEIINNVWAPRKEKIKVYSFSKTAEDTKKIAEHILKNIKENKNIICSITSKKNAQHLKNILDANSIVSKLYHGDNESLDTD